MKNKHYRFIISILLSFVMVVEGGISVAAISEEEACENTNNPVAEATTGENAEASDASGSEAGTAENLAEVKSLLEIKDCNGDELKLSELEKDAYDGFIYSVKDDATKSEIREMENNIDALSGKSEVEELVSNELYTADSLKTISEVASADLLEYVEPDYINELSVYSSEPNDPYYNVCYAMNGSVQGPDISYKNILSTMNVQKVWARGYFGSSDVTVAVLDSGVFEDHEELVGKVKENLVVTSGSVKQYKNTAEDRSARQAFHGTFASGVICAENNNNKGISGAMPAVKIVSMRIFFKGSDGELGASNSDIAAAITLATEKHVDVINMSFGQPNESRAVKSACEAAAKAGVILVAASGNASGSELVSSQYPAAYNSVISVGSVAAMTLKRSSFSNIDVDIVAPGEAYDGIGYPGLYNDGKSNSYLASSGTSFASPQIAALAAMAKSIDKDITPAEFKGMLYGTAVDLGASGRDALYGYGLADFEAVLNRLVGESGRADVEKTDIIEADVQLDMSTISDVYDGSAKEPAVKATIGNELLLEGEAYTVSYENNVNVGTATVTVKGINMYSSKITLTFDIRPKQASLGTLSRGKTSVTAKWSAQKSKMKTSRITGYQVQLAKNDSFTSGLKKATVNGYSKTSKSFTKLKRRTKYYVRVRTYMKVGGGYYYSDWSSVKSVKTK